MVNTTKHHNSGLAKLDFETLFADFRSFVNDLEVHGSIITIHLNAIVELRESFTLAIGPFWKLPGIDGFVPGDSAKFLNTGQSFRCSCRRREFRCAVDCFRDLDCAT